MCIYTYMNIKRFSTYINISVILQYYQAWRDYVSLQRAQKVPTTKYAQGNTSLLSLPDLKNISLEGFPSFQRGGWFKDTLWFRNAQVSWEWQSIPLTPVLGSQKKEDCYKFEASLPKDFQASQSQIRWPPSGFCADPEDFLFLKGKSPIEEGGFNWCPRAIFQNLPLLLISLLKKLPQKGE